MWHTPSLRTLSALSAAIALSALPYLSSAPISAGSALELRATEDESENPLGWLVGRWVGEGLGGWVEETWQPAAGGVMLGTFRLVVDGKPSFYELMTISGLDGEPTMGLKHFHPNLASWEEKDESLVWPASVLEEDRFGFGPVFYERLGEDSMGVSVELGGGEPEELQFRRVGL